MARSKTDHAPSRPKEFGGWLGAAVIVLGLPVFVTLVHVLATSFDFTLTDLTRLSVPAIIAALPSLAPTTYTVALVHGWIAFQVALYFLVPGKHARGFPDPDTGKVLEYPINGFRALLLSVFAVVAGYSVGLFSPTRLVANYSRLAVTSMGFSIVLATYLYVRGRTAKDAHRSDSFFYDFYMGVERHPRLFGLDLKYFFELRPGIIGWLCLCIVFSLAQHETTGAIHPALLVSTFLQGLYVCDALYFEEAILSTLDIVNDEFGYMLAFGDLSYVPFLYPLSSYYLVRHSPNWPAPVWCALLALGIFSMWAFRRSNSERDLFKLGKLPNAKTLTMVRHDGSTTQYLVSGFSAYARRPNYWPDLLNATVYALCTGFTSVLAWIYPILFFVLLTHRQHRIEEKGKRTYRNWDEYCHAVPYRYLPFIV